MLALKAMMSGFTVLALISSSKQSARCHCKPFSQALRQVLLLRAASQDLQLWLYHDLQVKVRVGEALRAVLAPRQHRYLGLLQHYLRPR